MEQEILDHSHTCFGVGHGTVGDTGSLKGENIYPSSFLVSGLLLILRSGIFCPSQSSFFQFTDITLMRVFKCDKRMSPLARHIISISQSRKGDLTDIHWTGRYEELSGTSSI